jgi:hypothetical protein
MRASLMLIAALVAVLPAGCSSDPSAAEWAGDVCAALDPWRTDIDDLTESANSALSPDTSPEQAKEDLTTLLAGAASASETARSAIAAAGVPDVAGGEDIAQRFTDSLAATRDAYQEALDDLTDLDAGDAGFYDDVATVMDDLSKDYARVPQVAELNSEELGAAFAADSRCQ